MSLRDDIARRLSDVLDDDYLSQDAWLRVADEVIRLMEWARTHGWTETVEDGIHMVQPIGPLTLPPDSWQP